MSAPVRVQDKPPDPSPDALMAVWQQAREQLGDPVNGAGQPELLDIDPAHNGHLQAVADHARLLGLRNWRGGLVLCRR